ncbi:class I SAM-dependent DNA methyltransferase [Methylobacterium sp. P31]
MRTSPNGPETVALYDAFAAEYDRHFDTEPLRRIYEQLGWERVSALLPGRSDTVVDVGCGTGRTAERLLALGHTVVGIEPSSAMQDVLRAKLSGRTGFTLLPQTMEAAEVQPRRAGAVLAIGSLQYASDPDAMVRRFVEWVRPGGLVCVMVDSSVALTFELLRLGRQDEALLRLEEQFGVFTYAGKRSGLHLFDAERVRGLLSRAGLVDIDACGILISISALGRAACEAAIREDETEMLATERRLQACPALTDAGKHLLAWGYRAEA